MRNWRLDTLSRDALDTADKSVERQTSRWPVALPVNNKARFGLKNFAHKTVTSAAVARALFHSYSS